MGNEKEQILETVELPSIKKVVDCPRCKAKIEVEFELDMDMVMPTPDVVKKLEEKYDKKLETPDIKPERMDHMDKGAKFENPFKRRIEK